MIAFPEAQLYNRFTIYHKNKLIPPYIGSTNKMLSIATLLFTQRAILFAIDTLERGQESIILSMSLNYQLCPYKTNL